MCGATANVCFGPRAGFDTVWNYPVVKEIEADWWSALQRFYIREGKVKVCVTSESGKEAVVAIHGNGDFLWTRNTAKQLNPISVYRFAGREKAEAFQIMFGGELLDRSE